MKAIFKIITNLFCIGILCACQSNKVPEGVLPLDKMEQIYQDMLLMDGYISTISKPDSAVMLRKAYQKAILEKYQVDTVVYKKSIDYYNSKPQIIEKVYEKIQQNLDTLHQKEVKKQTSKNLDTAQMKLEEVQ